MNFGKVVGTIFLAAGGIFIGAAFILYSPYANNNEQIEYLRSMAKSEINENYLDQTEGQASDENVYKTTLDAYKLSVNFDALKEINNLIYCMNGQIFAFRLSVIYHLCLYLKQALIKFIHYPCVEIVQFHIPN